ncbi:MAG: RNA-binding S4 domain-containing protein [Flavobacteriaceae bacterium]|nr:RNA-binding S4 domain-containing protein [Flavobacteriaceae bacterium]
MRIDKYLWAIRFYKSRSEASTACKKGQVRIGSAIAKPSREIFGTEQLTIRKNQMEHAVLVLDIPPSRVNAKLVERYAKDITSEEVRNARIDVATHQAQNKIDSGGRPSKKNRRDLLDFLENESTPNKD